MADNQVPWQGGGSFQPDQPCKFTARVQFDGAVNILDTVSVSATVAQDNTAHFLTVTGTLPITATNFLTEGIVNNITSAGSDTEDQYAMSTYLNAGYTGPGSTYAQSNVNGAAGTAVSGLLTNGYGNWGGFNLAFGTTTGRCIGVGGKGQDGNLSAGVLGCAVNTKNSGQNIGVIGLGRNAGTSSVEVGGYFGLHSADPTFASGALVADNGATTNPIILARDNGQTVWSVQDGGSVQGKMGTKTLSEGVATAFVRVACAQSARTGGWIKYTIEADDGADFQCRAGILPFAIVNKAGAETGAVATVSTATETVAVSAGTLTNTFTITSNAADTMDILANATSSLAQTTLRINYSVEMFGNVAVAVTAL